ncbi:unnamed protein product [Arabis nemorensis]|uniref:DUF4283 domain-containing protein n=1 Tax=Arabis nemorensis TaxID=586526 RepID=A0A565BME5_9BRAS|nr:unnamed protein product [Arabis nemorensis]
MSHPSYLEDGTPKIVIPANVIRRTSKTWKEFLISRFCGSAPPISKVIVDLSPIWGRHCRLTVHRASPTAYLFHIPNLSTRQWVLEVGLWQVLKCSLVMKYSPSDTIQSFNLVSAPIWVQLSNIPPEMFSEEAVSWIASGIGDPMPSNKSILDYSKIGEAKLKVEVFLTDDLPSEVVAADEDGNEVRIKATYPNIPFKCSIYHCFDHANSRCNQISRRNQSAAKSVAPSASTDALTLNQSTGSISHSLAETPNIAAPTSPRITYVAPIVPSKDGPSIASPDLQASVSESSVDVVGQAPSSSESDPPDVDLQPTLANTSLVNSNQPLVGLSPKALNFSDNPLNPASPFVPEASFVCHPCSQQGLSSNVAFSPQVIEKPKEVNLTPPSTD